MSFKVKALYDYASGHEDDLSFSVGQIITVTDEEDADWYGGEYVDESGTRHEGIFPRNFVEKYEPTAPPRPTRARPKRESEPALAPGPEAAAPPPPVAPPESPKHAGPEPEENPEPVTVASPSETVSAAPPVPAAAPAPLAPKPAESAQPPAPAPAPAPPAPQPAEAPSVSSPPAPKPASPPPKPSGPPPAPEKPTSSSFKDRIAAFNKAAAPPVTPFKPTNLSSGSSGFIKKPFVAPPPSRNAYVPPPTKAPVAKVYRRDEDPEVKEQEAEALENAEKAGLVPAASTNEGQGGDDQPKPMSLKERVALLQKQQMEAAARHAEAAAKKEKPKRPPKQRFDSQNSGDGEPAERTEETSRTSTDETHPPRLPNPPRRRSSKGTEPRDGNEADMSGAGDTTEGQEDLTEKEDSDGRGKHVATVPKQEESEKDEEDDEDEEEEEEDVDPEIRRREELRARMARMAGGMGMPGMGMPLFGTPAPVLPKKKKAAPEKRAEEAEESAEPAVRAAPVPLPGLMRPPPPPEPQHPEPEAEGEEEEEESRQKTPHQELAPPLPITAERGAPPPIPGGRPAPPPVPTDSRPPPPLPPSAPELKSPSEGSASDDELGESDATRGDMAQATRAPPPPPPVAAAAPPIPPTSPRASEDRRASYVEETSPTSPRAPAQSKRNSRPPPPIPSSPPPMQTRPPPPPPSAAPPLRRVSTGEPRSPPPVPVMRRDNDDDGEEEITEYEGDYDTDIASSVPHKDALKAHQRDSSFEDVMSPRSPTTEAPPVPLASPPRAGPPPIPGQPQPATRGSVDMPRTAPPPPPPPKESSRHDDDYDPYNYAAPSQGVPSVPLYPTPTPPAHPRQQEEMFGHESPSYSASQIPRSPPPPPPPGRGPTRQSVDLQRAGVGRRSVDVARPSMESGFVANDIDLAGQSGWWLQPNGLPPQLHGRKDIFFESEESTAADPHQGGGKTIVTRDIYVLFQDYSQTVITVRFNPRDPSDVHLEQRHEPPPRALRQDQLEQSYERFGRAIGEAAAAKKDTVVGDGTPQALVYELLRPFQDALLPVGTRAYGALVYSNLANASTTQNDEIRPGDIVSIRNAKFQGKHGAMHAKYTMEVGKPDHVGVVAEWDGTKKKVRAWEQGRESKKVKLESFKLDDLRSGEVKVWRVMPRSWIGWEGAGAGSSGGGSGGVAGGGGNGN